MSLYTEWLNKIKAMASAEWLTSSQREAYDSIAQRWQGSFFICLTGPPGCGKTFIARMLARELGYAYVHDIQEVQPEQSQVLVDGQQYNRLMRPAAALLKVKRVIILSRRAPKDPMPRAEVVAAERDVRQFQHNLTKYGILPSFTTEVRGTDFAEILRSEAIARGGF